jgi:FKBP-type peptidyl-prolyl cis-trans isomerase FklB
VKADVCAAVDAAAAAAAAVGLLMLLTVSRVEAASLLRERLHLLTARLKRCGGKLTCRLFKTDSIAIYDISITSMIAFTRSAALCGFIAACFVAAAIAGTTPEGQAWLASKGKEDGVVSTGSGLLYKVLKNGPDGAKKPNIDTPCECHYKGTLIDGREFDSSYSRGMPATFAPNQVIKGWTEAMQLMKEGDHWELYIPSELAYGDANRHVRAHVVYPRLVLS